MPGARNPAGEDQRDAGGRQHGQRHLQQAQPEHMLAHAAQPWQVELQADHKHQKHYAELTQPAHAFRVLRQRKRIRANHHAHRQITQHGRQLQAAAGHHTQHRSQQVEQGNLKGGHGPILARDLRSIKCANDRRLPARAGI
jgi:hypothetical protein